MELTSLAHDSRSENKDSFNAILSWVFTPVFLVLFGGVLAVFHPILVLTNSLNRRLGNFFLACMNLCLLGALRAVGTTFKVTIPSTLPAHGPIIVVSNHQSMFDIPLLMWHFRRFAIKFVAKVELGRWIPSVSYVLRSMGSVLIDRSERAGALPIIRAWGRRLEKERLSGCIFPEGTRARDGVLKRFKGAGLVVLLEAMPSAVVIPAAIRESWKLLRYGFRPVPFGLQVSLKVFAPIDRAGKTPQEIVEEAERVIRGEIEGGAAKPS